MKELKNQLIRLGNERPELREHLRPVLDKIANNPPEFVDAVHEWEEKVAWYIARQLPVHVLSSAPRVQSSYTEKEIHIELQHGIKGTITLKTHIEDYKIEVSSTLVPNRSFDLDKIDHIINHINTELEAREVGVPRL